MKRNQMSSAANRIKKKRRALYYSPEGGVQDVFEEVEHGAGHGNVR